MPGWSLNVPVFWENALDSSTDRLIVFTDFFCLLLSLPFFFLSSSQVSSQVSTNINDIIAGEMPHLKKDGSSIISGVARIVLKKSFSFWCGGGGDEESAGDDTFLDVFGGDYPEGEGTLLLVLFCCCLLSPHGISSSRHEISWKIIEEGEAAFCLISTDLLGCHQC